MSRISDKGNAPANRGLVIPDMPKVPQAAIDALPVLADYDQALRNWWRLVQETLNRNIKL